MSSKPYFDDIADQWDDMRSQFFSEGIRDKALALAGVAPGKVAADIGAGSGFIAEGLLQAGLRVVAVDQSEAMLDVMRRKFGLAALVDYRVGTAEALPLADASLDFAFANMYLHHVESPADAIREIARALKPGGRLVISDMDEHHFGFLVTEQHDRWMGFKREDIKRWFEQAGLKNVVVDCADENCCADSTAGSDRAEVSIFLAVGQK